MSARKKWLVAVAVMVVVGAVLTIPEVRFVLGGALVNAGYRFQDDLHDYDFHHENVTPAEVWAEFQRQNELASAVRTRFPRSTNHPLVAMLVCMDARIDTNELAGDTRRNYYVVRTAGSVISPEEGDMLELAVVNGVKLVVLTRHTDCAAEKAARNPELRARFPALVASVDEREQRVKEFLARPTIAAKLASGELLVNEVLIDTSNEHVAAAP